MKLGIIIPAFNEGEGLIHAVAALDDLFQRKLAPEIDQKSLIVIVDDGSSDQSWNVIQNLKSSYFDIHGIKFSKNFGHQAALWAGLEYVSARVDINVCIDADLQHDIEVIPEFIAHYKQGSEIVYGVKRTRGEEKLLKRILSVAFYKILTSSGVTIIDNHADFRLMSKKSTTELLKFRERNLFLRGIIPSLGFKSAKVYYDVKDRMMGESKYSLRKMLSLALTGITSFGVAPLRFVSGLGLLCFLLSILMTVYVLMKYFSHESVPGWASTLIPIYFLGGLQLLGLGIIGEYLGKIYFETKKRPLYIIEEITTKNE
jgi:polyisoprenyl-phosphate glycosyltransferase